MHSRILLIAVAAAVSLPSAATAYQTDANTAQSDQDRVVCKRESVVGSRVQKRRTCMTKKEWTKLQVGARDGTSQFIKEATAGAPRT